MSDKLNEASTHGTSFITLDVDERRTLSRAPAAMSSADTRPISPSRFAAALKELSVEMLHLKVLEIRNSIAHLQYSNDQLRPFAEGAAAAAALPRDDDDDDDDVQQQRQQRRCRLEPDQDCIDAIRENEIVIDRMAERIALIRVEVEDERGLSWAEFQAEDEAAPARHDDKANGDIAATASNGVAHPAWSDGTFQTGTMRAGGHGPQEHPAGLTDEELRMRLEGRLAEMNGGDDEDGDDAGLHL